MCDNRWFETVYNSRWWRGEGWARRTNLSLPNLLLYLRVVLVSVLTQPETDVSVLIKLHKTYLFSFWFGFN